MAHPPPWPRYDAASIARCQELLAAGRSYDYERGAEIQRLEDSFALHYGRTFSLAVNSGTSALFLAFLAAGLGPGDEVIVPTYTFLATGTPLLWLGAVPILVDAGDDTGNLDRARIEPALTARTRAIVVTHLFGHPCDMLPIAELARSRGLTLIEDCSHAHGSTERGRRVGTWGDAAVFSVGGRKMVSGGMGGMLLTDSSPIFELACLASAPKQRSLVSVH
ncbi:DegT/DnrJ/EryC1/StrS family aminotransferase, partial [Frankia sp. Cr1]|uniref:DegT/DnrJ/EryC1/StrS family aminotransferase n=1 Tax=Frankia sp. Cr1 TaxID=3073931 RepID=UPI002AD4B559